MRLGIRARPVWIIVCVFSIALGDWSPGGARQIRDSLQYREERARGGERCLICGTELTPTDVILIYRGRRVPLRRSMVEEFVSNPDRYFFKLEPRAALFDERAVVDNGLPSAWLLIGLWIFSGLLFGGLSAHLAVLKGLRPLPWFVCGFLGNALGYLAVVLRRADPKAARPTGWTKVHLTSEPKQCANCGAELHPSARTCPSCGASSTPEIESEVERIRGSKRG